MMFAKTFCKPGSYVEVVPIGLQAMLIYNANGLLQSVKVLQPDNNGHGFHQEVDAATLRKIYEIVPTRINLKGGTTYVEGVFHTGTLPKDSQGNIAYCANDEYVKKINDGDYFEFYAGNVRSLAAMFRGSLTIRNWLSGNGFKILPGIIVPVEMKQETIDMLVNTGAYSFDSDFIAGFYIFEGTAQARFSLSNLHYYHTSSFKRGIDQNGYVKGVVKLADNSEVIFNLSDAINFKCDAAPYINLLLANVENDSEPIQIVRSVATNKNVDELHSSVYICPICHKQVILPKTGPCQCSDPHCLSSLYPDACRLFEKLALPELDYSQYMQYVENKYIICLTDLLVLDNYKDVEINVTLPEALAAITPFTVVSDENIFEKFCNSCNNSVDSLLYYLKNPNKIITELNVNSPMVVRFIKWISDPYNLTSVETILAHVNIKERTKKFEGAPIFRSNAFVLTGTFKRGNFTEIASILESYSATVLTDIDITGSHVVPSAVITGSTNENISGHIIKTARSYNIPVISEDEFFSNYGIDDDIASNLL